MMSNLSFREQLKRMRPSFKVDRTGVPVEPQFQTIEEDTHQVLLPDGRPSWEDRHKLHKPDHSKLRAIFLSKKYTPGCQSSNPFKRLSAMMWHEFKLALLSDHVNCLLVFLPLSVVSNVLAWDSVLVFVLNYCAIIPLVSLISYATQERSFGRIPHVIFCNTAELIIAIIATHTGQIKFLNSFILGSLVNNILLVSGISFFFGGIYNMRGAWGNGIQQAYSNGTSTSGLSLMGLFSGLCIVITAVKSFDLGQDDAFILIVSRGASIAMLCLYLLYLCFSLYTHRNMFRPELPDSYSDYVYDYDQEEEGEDEEASVGRRTAVFVLICSISMLAFCILHLMRSFDAVIQTRNVTASSLGFVFIPFACSGAKNAIAVDLAIQNDMDQALNMAIEPSLQLALLITPAMIFLSWTAGQRMSLEFDSMEVIAFFLSVMAFARCVPYGRSDYLEGTMLIGLYTIIGTTVYFLQPALG